MINFMKTFIFFLFFTLKGFAADPSTICDENSFCTQPMIEIVSGFKNGGSQFTERPLSGFSGGCYYISSLYNSGHQHHGAFIFDRTQSGLFAAGEFSFFTAEDPYQNMNSVELKNWFIKNKSNFTKAIATDKQVELQYMGNQYDLHYWFRSNAEKNKLYVLGQQFSGGQSDSVFCEMSARN